MVSVNASATDNYNININKKFGEGIIEISTTGDGTTSWNSAFSKFVGANGSSSYPFFIRGGYYGDRNAGSLYFGHGGGRSDVVFSFRLALSVM